MMRGIALALACIVPACAADRPRAPEAPSDIGVEPEPASTQPGTMAQQCSAGDPDACWNVAVGHRFADAQNPEDPDSPLRGLEGAASDAAVRELLGVHCEAGHAPSCAEIAWTYPLQLGQGPQAAANAAMRRLYLERACDEGDSGSCMLIAHDFLDDEEPDVASFYFLRACEIGDSNEAEAACRALE